MRTTGTAYLLWFFLGFLGVHKFYLGKPVLGVLYACTLGFLGIGLIIDLFTIPTQVRAINYKLAGKIKEFNRLAQK
ncbi:MAG: NINE protein [Anaerolineaceae bacterium]|nr:NINE protein [Anaerolineaceae bacterium]